MIHKKCGTTTIRYGKWNLCPTCQDIVFGWRDSLSYIKANWFLFLRYLLMSFWIFFFLGVIAGLSFYRGVIP